MSYEIGRMINTHGIRGEVKVKTDSDFDRFVVGKTVYLFDKEEKREFTIKAVRKFNQGLIIKFQGIDDINDIEYLKGSLIYTDEKPVLKEDEYHYKDLIGLNVYNKNNELIGIVNDVMDVPQGHLLQVKTSEKMVLIPFVSAFIKEINDQSIKIEEIEGLL
ncbi:MAG: ribosome maturation factor RimM [Paracholeplasma sp.]|uniref:Ribosome maturation factor RimM n=1 Tax=Acholeplasma brassicae TaxID=61635 RepID=U4KS73_9MOLU|nr:MULTISPECIES: ribosome maturation factor RimM [Paracholeplasma]MDY3195394.1 ribosome maturation factor RimM [Paracholeplasma sp.]CCV66378.1 Ribosome maturation factor RimM [Paracholeplasma brassicae]